MITMLNLIVGIAIFLFIFLGLREGIVKSLGSVALVFVALFLASGTLNFLAKARASLNSLLGSEEDAEVTAKIFLFKIREQTDNRNELSTPPE